MTNDYFIETHDASQKPLRDIPNNKIKQNKYTNDKVKYYEITENNVYKNHFYGY